MSKRSLRGKFLSATAHLFDFDALKKAAEKQAEIDAKNLLEKAGAKAALRLAALTKLEQTTKNWRWGMDENTFTPTFRREDYLLPGYDGVPEFQVSDIRVVNGRIQLDVWTDNVLWNRLDRGVPARVRETLEVFNPRLEQRTIPGTLEVGGRPEYADYLVKMLPGTVAPPVDAREWSKTVAEELMDEFRNYPLKIKVIVNGK